AEFKHMIKRTKDPKQRYDSALKYLAENFYQYSKKFSDCPTSVFPPGSPAAEQMLAAGTVTLVFEEKNQKYKIPCSVRKLDVKDKAWQATYWHNHLFNSVMPGDVAILQFVPDWTAAEAQPPVY
ncbi:MAG: hypothetical protein HON65_09715, partial [Rhodospirillales bacterium]|nr:hypothetical protein [Rhodospirillales bacterium]